MEKFQLLVKGVVNGKKKDKVKNHYRRGISNKSPIDRQHLIHEPKLVILR